MGDEVTTLRQEDLPEWCRGIKPCAAVRHDKIWEVVWYRGKWEGAACHRAKVPMSQIEELMALPRTKGQ